MAYSEMNPQLSQSMQESYPPNYSGDTRGYPQTQQLQERQMPEPQPCAQKKPGLFGLGFMGLGGKRRKRTKRKRPKRRKSRRS